MRLINADKLIEDLEKVKKESESLVDISHIIGFQSVIDAQPTAFDADKVIEQLEDLVKINMEVLNVRADYVNLAHVIKIVKAGEIDE